MKLRARGRAGGVAGRVTLKWRDHKAAIWERVTPEPNTGCWLWTAAVSSTGYGSVRLGDGVHNAHRLSYEAHVGPAPEGMLLLHRCDQRSCVNPDHLSPGTQADNIADMMRKGRHWSQRVA